MVKEIHNIVVAQKFGIFYELESIFALGQFKYSDE